MRFQHPAALNGQKIVIIIGGGFGGFNAAKVLAKKPGVYVLLIDQRNHHLFQPLLYQVATAGLNPGDIAVPIRAEFAKAKNIEVHWKEIGKINLQEKYVQPKNEDLQISFDYLIMACGARHSYFAHPEWEDFAPGLKTLEHATEIRRRILSAFENAENEPDPEAQKSMMTFVIVGGGATGVELAGAIADICRTVLMRDFRRIDPSKSKIILVEAGPKLLPAFAESLSARTLKDLQELGVEVRLSTRVERIDSQGVQMGAEWISTQGVFWAAGVQAAKLDITPTVESDRAGRIKVQKDLSIVSFPECFVIGDMAAVELGNGGLVPGLAPAAIQEGRHAASNILASLSGKERQPFKYIDKGQMATIGKHRAVLELKKWRMGGYPAWIAWLFVHIFYLVGFKNRLAVMFLWAWSYLFSKRGSRLITDRQWKN